MHKGPEGQKQLSRRHIPIVWLAFFVMGHTPASYAADPLLPSHDILPNAKTAIAVGRVILQTYFPKALQARNSPGFGANDRGTVWEIYEELPRGMVGGSPTVELAKHDGRVVRIYMTE